MEGFYTVRRDCVEISGINQTAENNNYETGTGHSTSLRWAKIFHLNFLFHYPWKAFNSSFIKIIISLIIIIIFIIITEGIYIGYIF